MNHWACFCQMSGTQAPSFIRMNHCDIFVCANIFFWHSQLEIKFIVLWQGNRNCPITIIGNTLRAFFYFRIHRDERILTHSLRNLRLRRQYTIIFVAEFKTKNTWLTEIIIRDHNENWGRSASAQLADRWMMASSWIFIITRGKWHIRKIRMIPMKMAAKLSSLRLWEEDRVDWGMKAFNARMRA